MRDHDCFSSDIEPLQERGAYTTAVVATSLDSKQANFSPPDARSQYGMTAIKAVQMRGLRESEDVLCEAIARFAKKKNGEKIEEVFGVQARSSPFVGTIPTILMDSQGLVAASEFAQAHVELSLNGLFELLFSQDSNDEAVVHGQDWHALLAHAAHDAHGDIGVVALQLQT